MVTGLPDMATRDFEQAIILNPKRDRDARSGRAGWYPYYAGFSPRFAYALLESCDLCKDACVLDPWNGAGTTTAAAAALGHHAVGFDLNPVMVIAARARMLAAKSKTDLTDLAQRVIRKARSYKAGPGIGEDPLSTWVVPARCDAIRNLERSIQACVLEREHFGLRKNECHPASMPATACFFYTALFRTVRSILAPFYTSNPTWTKTPKKTANRLRPSRDLCHTLFLDHVSAMAAAVDDEPIATDGMDTSLCLDVASSGSLPLEGNSVDFVLSSPPYCTRIDYAVATMAELAVLGYARSNGFCDLRKSLIGTSTVPQIAPEATPEWGATCNRFLETLASHTSKASSTYYYKNHVQYFDGIFRSLGEIARVQKPGSGCVLVVQDSYYKDVHNDLPRIVTEMAEAKGMALGRYGEFQLNRTLAAVNPGVRPYRATSKATEVALFLHKPHEV